MALLGVLQKWTAFLTLTEMDSIDHGSSLCLEYKAAISYHAHFQFLYASTSLSSLSPCLECDVLKQANQPTLKILAILLVHLDRGVGLILKFANESEG